MPDSQYIGPDARLVEIRPIRYARQGFRSSVFAAPVLTREDVRLMTPQPARILARLSLLTDRGRPVPLTGVDEAGFAALLERQGLSRANADPDRPYLLFAAADAAAVAEAQDRLKGEAAWHRALDQARVESWNLRFHAGPAGAGRRVLIGAGHLQGDWRTYGIQDGLPSPSVRDLLQDRRGLLWLATHSGGVCCFDGAEWCIYNRTDGLPDDRVYALLEDRQGDLWFGTQEGLCRCRFADGEAHFELRTREDGLSADHIAGLFENPRGELWVEHGDKSLSRGRRVGQDVLWRPFAAAGGPGGAAALDEVPDRRGRKWLARNSGLYAHLRTATAGGAAPGPSPRGPEAKGKAGRFWLTNDRLFRCAADRRGGLSFELFSRDEGLPEDAVFDVLEDRRGRLWVATFTHGLCLCENPYGDTPRFTGITTADGLANNQTVSLFEDEQGAVWVGTYGGGVSRLEENHIRGYTAERDGLADNGVMSLHQDRGGDLWIGTWNGASRYDGARFHPVAPFAGRSVNGIAEDAEGKLWFAVGELGLCRLEGGEAVCLTEEDGLLSSVHLTAVLVDRRGGVWCATGSGLCRYDGRGFASYPTRHKVTCLAEDRRGRVWFGMWDGGLGCFDAGSFTYFTALDGLAHDHVTHVMEDGRGRLWISTWGGGVSVYDGEGFATYTTADGLAHNMLRSAYEDPDGHVWICTFGGGVNRWDGRLFQTLSRKDGLVHDTTQQILRERGGAEYWIATEGGLSRYRPQGRTPRVTLRDVIADRHYGAAQALSIPVSQDFLLFSFQGVSWTTGPDGLAYAYRLKGHRDQWSYTRERQVEYRGLALGDYRFEIRAIDRDLNYSEPLRVALRVEADPHMEALAEATNSPADEFVGDSAPLRLAQRQLAEVAPTEVTVLLFGETGTGKGLAARTLHRLSGRSAGPFIQVNCGAIPAGLVESELFGHEKGAFTGAASRRLGKAELAAGGTLFLDEIGDLAADSQVKLLRLLEEQVFERVGGSLTQKADLRVVAATNRDLRRMVDEGQFRQDLYFRLVAFVVELPPLRRRRDDIARLAPYFMRRMATHLKKRVESLGPSALERLRAYDWPGNVRELQHVIQRAVIVCQTGEIQVGDLALENSRAEGDAGGPYAMEEVERRHIRSMLEKTGWVVGGRRGAAVLLEMNESTLRSRMRKLGIRRPEGP